MKLRKLNAVGLERFGQFLDSLTTDGPEAFPAGLLTELATSDAVDSEAEVELRTFDSRFEAAQYLNEQLADAGIANLERDRGLWAWLAAFYVEQLCPVDSEGRRRPGERARWIPAVTDYRKYYRHLLAGPYRIYRAHHDDPQRALALLCTPPHRPGDIAEQLASRQELVTNPAVIQAATWLYVDSSRSQPRRGAAGRGPGSARRLAQVLDQLDVTWDLYAMDANEVLGVLPGEFDRFPADRG